ncbi:hypothetical protein BN1232_03067 [Mycobacterium lentiflavum]|uniref:Uncharacterized protein n=1 Tax=Mycobacterium lentiflavum TaxID=141349 RepID=A0A0E4H1E9_MYCLN|nr:hypothetical protein BN1232_03067 [Mycobacterium lentiflavum]
MLASELALNGIRPVVLDPMPGPNPMRCRGTSPGTRAVVRAVRDYFFALSSSWYFLVMCSTAWFCDSASPSRAALARAAASSVGCA